MSNTNEIFKIREKSFIIYKTLELQKNKIDLESKKFDVMSILGTFLGLSIIAKKPTISYNIIFPAIGGISFLQYKSYNLRLKSYDILDNIKTWKNIHKTAFYLSQDCPYSSYEFKSLNSKFNIEQSNINLDENSYKYICEKYKPLLEN